MKLMNIILYLALIAVCEGALHEYLWWTGSHAKQGNYQAIGEDQKASEGKKESSLGILEIFMLIMQALWAFLVGIARWIWHGICEWIELVLMILECTELAHKLAERFHLWGGMR